MFSNNRSLKIKIFIVISIFLLTYTSVSYAQYWSSLPPYNTLWPLWSAVLSPIDPLTNLPTPIVSGLSASTVLPLQPGLTWNPALPNPWLLYNSPVGLLYYDPLFGINTWPPNSLIDSITGNPIPISLPLGYSNLAPTISVWISNTVPVANIAYQLAYPPFATAVTPPLLIPLPPALVAIVGTIAVPVPPLPPPFTSLLTPLSILTLNII